MRRSILIALTCALLSGAIGCSGPESLTKRQIASLNEMIEAIEKKDERKVRKIANEMRKTGEKIKLLKLNRDQRKVLADKYKPQWDDAVARYREAAKKDIQFIHLFDPTFAAEDTDDKEAMRKNKKSKDEDGGDTTGKKNKGSGSGM